MGVRIDKARCNHFARSIDFAIAGLVHSTDPGDTAILYGDISVKGRHARAIHHASIANYQIVHLENPLLKILMLAGPVR